jgi:hypothetical protein
MLNKIINKLKGDKKMDNEQLYSMGEVIDKLEQGYYAVSTASQDKGFMFSVDEENRMYAVFPEQNYKSHVFSFRRDNVEKGKRYTIKVVDEDIQELFDSLEFKNSIDLWLEENEESLRQHYMNKLIQESINPIVKQHGVEGAFAALVSFGESIGYKFDDAEAVKEWLECMGEDQI